MFSCGKSVMSAALRRIFPTLLLIPKLQLPKCFEPGSENSKMARLLNPYPISAALHYPRRKVRPLLPTPSLSPPSHTHPHLPLGVQGDLRYSFYHADHRSTEFESRRSEAEIRSTRVRSPSTGTVKKS